MRCKTFLLSCFCLYQLFSFQNDPIQVLFKRLQICIKYKEIWIFNLEFKWKKIIFGRIFIISYFTTKTWIFGANYWYWVPIYRIIIWQAWVHNNVLLLKVVACLQLHFSVLKINILKKYYNVYQIPKEIQFIQKKFKKKNVFINHVLNKRYYHFCRY